MAALRAGALELDKARAVNEVARTLIDSAKVEVEYLRVAGDGKSAFLEAGNAAGGEPRTANALPAWHGPVTRHRLEG